MCWVPVVSVFCHRSGHFRRNLSVCYCVRFVSAFSLLFRFLVNCLCCVILSPDLCLSFSSLFLSCVFQNEVCERLLAWCCSSISVWMSNIRTLFVRVVMCWALCVFLLVVRFPFTCSMLCFRKECCLMSVTCHKLTLSLCLRWFSAFCLPFVAALWCVFDFLS